MQVSAGEFARQTKRHEKSCEAVFPTVVNRPRFCNSMIRSIVYGRRSGSRFASRHSGQDTRVRPRLLQLKSRILLWLQTRNVLERS
jgi:hypothetical protein